MSLQNLLKKGFEKVITCLEATKSYLDKTITHLENFNQASSLTGSNAKNFSHTIYFPKDFTDEQKTDLFASLVEKYVALFGEESFFQPVKHPIGFFYRNNKPVGLTVSFDNPHSLIEFKKNIFGVSATDFFKEKELNFQP